MEMFYKILNFFCLNPIFFTLLKWVTYHAVVPLVQASLKRSFNPILARCDRFLHDGNYLGREEWYSEIANQLWVGRFPVPILIMHSPWLRVLASRTNIVTRFSVTFRSKQAREAVSSSMTQSWLLGCQ